MTYYSNSETDTINIGREISGNVKSGDIFLINGDLGAGKSVLVRGIASGLGINTPMPSPTFTIVNDYKGKFLIYHFDLYRINDPFELYEIGFEDYIYSQGVTFIEWPSKAGELLPENAINIDIKFGNDNSRIIDIKWKE